MRTTLRVAFLLLGWVLLATGAWAQPAPKDQSAQILNPNSGRVTLGLPLAVSSGTVTSYTITGPLPTAAQGTLWVNGTQVTAVPRTVALADAGSIQFNPATTFFGTYFFKYTATGTGGTSTAASYGISVAKTACNVTSPLNLFDRANESWQGPTYPSITVGGTTLTASAFTQATSANGTTSLSVTDDLTMPGKALTWSADYSSESTTANASSITLTFSRPVKNFSMTVGDLDVGSITTTNGWIDQLTVNGYSTTAATTPITLTSSDYALGPNGDNVYSGSNVFTGTGENAATSDDLAGANLIITFSQAVQKVVLTYRNTTTAASGNDPSKQVLTIPAMSWCAEADVVTTLAGPASLTAGQASGNYTVTFDNNGPDDASSVTRTVTIPANVASAVTPVSGGTVSGSQAAGWTITYPGGTILASAAASSYTFNLTPLPNVSSITVSSATSTTTDQGANTGADAASVALNVTQIADVTTTLTGPGSLSAGLQSGDYTATYTNNGPSTAASTTRTVTIPANTVSAVSAPSATSVSGSQATGWTITFPAGSNVAAGASGAVSYTFKVTPGLLTSGTSINITSATSTTTSEGTNTAPNTSAVSYTVGAVADVTTTLTGPGSLLAGVVSGNYTATYTNNGPSTAASTTRTVTIPANTVSAVSAPSATSVSGSQATGWTITFPAGSNVVSGNSVSYNFTLTPLAVTSVSASSATSTTTSQGLNTAADASTVTLNVTPIADVYAQFTTPATTSTTATAGTTVNYTVQFGNNGPSSADGVTRVVTVPAGVPSVSATGATVTGSQAAGWTITYPGGTFATGTSASYNFSIVAPASGSPQLTALTTTTTSQNGATSNDSQTRTLNVTPIVLSGNIFDDVNYGGGAGRDYATANSAATASGFASGAILRPNATVELYDASGNYVASTTSNASGQYSFNVPAAATYTVRVVNGTVTPARTLNSGFTAANTSAVQTFVNGDVNRVGGENPTRIDAGANTTSATLTSLTAGSGATATTAQSIKAVTVPAAGLTGIDFGFNFDVVVNTNDAGQGSLRQFIQNSNALANTSLAQAGLTAGVETSLFMISDGAVHNGLRSGLTNQLTNGAATITLSTALTTITDASTALNGTTQTSNVSDSNAAVTTTGSESTGPEVVINFGGTDGFATTGASTRVISLGFTNANTSGGSGTAALRVDAGATNAIIQNNTFYANGANFRLNNVGGATVTGNISRNALASNSDGIEMTASSNNTITGNQFLNNAGYGIDFISGQSNGNTITGNVFARNGQSSSNGQTAGIGLRDGSSNNNISGNTFTGNIGDGISANNGSNNVFSQNSFSANGNLGIDLTTTTNNDGDGVTLNDSGDADANTAAANGLINFPIISSSTIRNGNLIVEGFARPGVTVELYVADPDATGFGEGQTYFTTFVEGSSADTNTGTGTYSGLINGRNQGTDNTNRFTVSIALSSLSSALRTALTTSGAQLTALSTLSTNTGGNYGTSEFSGNSPVLSAPVATNDAAVTAPATPVTLTVTSNDLNSIDAATVALNGLAAGSTTAVAVTGGTFQFLSNGQVQFTPTAGFTGIATVPYTVNNTSGVSSNTAFISVEVRTPSIDLSTTISAPANNTAINAGAALTYTVVATNGTATAASTVVETLQLPAGLTTNGGTVTITGGQNFAAASYDNTTGVVTIPVGTLAASSSQTYNVAVSAMPGTGPVTATATISGAVTETNTANNSVATTVTINPRYDVATTITGPATGVVRGNEITYTVTTSNLSTTAGSASPAANVVQVVQLTTGLTGVFASNGGTYNSNDGKVTFPAISSLPVGQTVVNSISFAAPAANFTVPSATVTAGASSDNAGDLNSPSVGTNNNTAYLNGLGSTATVATSAPSASQVNVYTSISSSATNVAPNTSVTLTVTANNAGPATATAVTETLQLPAGLAGVTVSNGGTYNATTGLVTFTSFGDLAPAGSASATVTFTAPAQGFVLASATVMTAATDLVPADNLAQIKVEVAPVANVATTLAGPTTVVPGQTASYTVTTSSLGEAPAVGVVQTVSLPAGLTGVTVSNGGTYNATTGLVTFSFGSPLSKGTTQTNSISFTVPTGATNYSAVANVSTTTPETVLTNNAATVATTVQQTADLVESISGPSTAGVGSAVTYTTTTTNNGPSTATSVVPTLQLPAGLNAGGTVIVPGGSYDNASGLVTFGTVTALASGAAVTNTATFIMPDASSVNGLAKAGAASAEANLDNNFASVVTTGATPGTGTANLGTTIAASTTQTSPNGQVTIATGFTNAVGSDPAANVALALQLPAGLGTVVVSGGTGGSYNNTTGLVTWNSPGTLNGNAALPGYQVVFNAPANLSSFTATSFISSATTPESNLTNNAASLTVTVAPSADVATGISGPSTTQPGATVTYAVTTLNNGVSAASSTQTVRIPDTATNIVVPAGSTQSAASGGFITITFPAISNQPSGAAGEVTNYVSFTAPSTAYTVSAALTPGNAVGDDGSNNTASVSTSLNRAPVAYNVVNALQTPEANTAAPLLISPLVATDADNNTLTYTITSLPATAAGILYLGTGTGSPITNGQTLTAAQISTLRFDPVTNFVGNAFFTYTATDNATAPATSNTAIYTIAVGQDVNSAYVSAPNRGGSASNYANGDLIGYLIDANSFRYTSSGALYNTAVANGTLISGADTGVRLTTTDAAGTSLLSSLGLALNTTTGEIRVTDRNLLRGGSYSLTITTLDANGGTNTQQVSISIGFGPLPVTLVEFTAKAQGDAALLTWKTAQEKNNDHFDVERSIDGLHFEKVGQVSGHGTSTVQQQYSFTDAGASRLAGKVYYRLQQVDTDGTTTASDARVVSFDKAGTVELTLFPNPASETLNIRLAGATEASQVTVYSATGALVLQGKLAGSLSTAFDVRTLPAGTYLVKVQAANGQPLTRRFVKY
ncbi:DUF11 domain-containing protein [Hymenobacter sp. 15J16-1T3B]|uniref:T9SS type A sorting domain-containing protein n=1 Tax=Hymenobacter sp. 15J16-1T3B TaxID=2886941 RepID=UPI001D129540|nr:T9SS type A sorting domain-containing protein [Hymenobacter sp. 15J16-1T3B]MCC3156711.1 DUF11 domain-containing protein [Hymenobacter sp. 15J16-1T3B]